MTARRIVFVDRDGTLVEEPPDEQVDSLAKIRFMPDVFAAMLRLKTAGFAFVMVSNQDGLATASLPADTFETAHRFILDAFASQGLYFEAVFICPHFKRDACRCRKPQLGLLDEYLVGNPLDQERSFVIGDRDTDLEFASNLGIQGVRVRLGDAQHSWPAAAERILGATRRGRCERRTRETHVVAEVDLSRESPQNITTGLGFFDHMLEQLAKHGGFALSLTCRGDLEIDEHHTIEDCALALGAALREALGDKRGISRYGFLLAMDESQARVALDLSGRPYFVWSGRFNRERVGELPTELVPHFFRSLAQSLGAALHVRVRGENSHHMIEACFKAVGRSLRQAVRLEGIELPSTKGLL